MTTIGVSIINLGGGIFRKIFDGLQSVNLGFINVWHATIKQNWAIRWVEEDGGKDLWNEFVLSLEWKRVGVMGSESGGDGAGRPRWVEWEE